MTGDLDFRVSTRRTGRRRLVRVTVYRDHDSFLNAFRRECARRELVTGEHDDYLVEAACFPRVDWADRDPHLYQVRILFSLEHITATNIAHEATHAAMHIYSVDSFRDHSRASAHLHIANEPVAYMVGDLFSAIALRVMDAGHPIDVGRSGRDVNDIAARH